MPEHDQAVPVDPEIRTGFTQVSVPDTIIQLAERIAKIEALLTTIAEHQSQLGTSLIRAHSNLIKLERDMAAEGIGIAEDEARSSIIGVAPKPIII